MEKTKKKEFVEIKYTGYANGQIFDSNIAEDLKKINPEAKEQKTIVCIGEGMVVPGLDRALENKDIDKEFEIDVAPKEGFGERKKELITTIPLKSFTEKNIAPRTGMMLTLDNYLVKILAVSGARVTVDFNNPLSGKHLKYKFKIIRKVDDKKEKIESLFMLFFKFIPEFEIGDKGVIIRGARGMKILVDICKEKFKELIGEELSFEEVDEKKEKNKDK